VATMEVSINPREKKAKGEKAPSPAAGTLTRLTSFGTLSRVPREREGPTARRVSGGRWEGEGSGAPPPPPAKTRARALGQQHNGAGGKSKFPAILHFP